MPRTNCPACEGLDLETLYHLPSIPVQSVVLLNTQDEALTYPRGELTLTLCKGCGFLFNSAFRSELVDYSSTAEESQHFSGTFNTFAKELAAEIAALRDLKNKTILEIGCGKGDFLEELVRQTGANAIGIDPGFIPERLNVPLGQSMKYMREYFDPARIDAEPDLVLCRHTLEHIAEVGTFMTDVMSLTHGKTNADVVFETPDVARVLDEGAFWDIYHEHCSYFTIGSHARLFRRAGLDVRRSYLAYSGQYIIQYAKPGRAPPRPEEDDLERILSLCEAFPARVSETRTYWNEKVRDAFRAGRQTVIWGGGSKAVSFMTTNHLDKEIDRVVDINVHKQGKYMPGTGHLVTAPESLVEDPPQLVIVMNPVYLKEIRKSLSDLGVNTEIVAL